MRLSKKDYSFYMDGMTLAIGDEVVVADKRGLAEKTLLITDIIGDTIIVNNDILLYYSDILLYRECEAHPVHKHTYKDYVGFTESYDYCTECNERKA